MKSIVHNPSTENIENQRNIITKEFSKEKVELNYNRKYVFLDAICLRLKCKCKILKSGYLNYMIITK